MNLLQIIALVLSLVGLALFIKQKSSNKVPWSPVLPPGALMLAFLLSLIGAFIGDEEIDKDTVKLQLAVARTAYLYPAEKLKQKINSGTVIYMTRVEESGPGRESVVNRNPPEAILKEGLGTCTLKILRLKCMTLEAKDFEAALATQPQAVISDIGLSVNEELEAVLEKSTVPLLLIEQSSPGSLLHYLQSGYIFGVSCQKDASWDKLISQANGVSAKSSSEELFNLGHEFYDKNRLPPAFNASAPPTKSSAGNSPAEKAEEE